MRVVVFADLEILDAVCGIESNHSGLVITQVVSHFYANLFSTFTGTHIGDARSPAFHLDLTRGDAFSDAPIDRLTDSKLIQGISSERISIRKVRKLVKSNV